MSPDFPLGLTRRQIDQPIADFETVPPTWRIWGRGYHRYGIWGQCGFVIWGQARVVLDYLVVRAFELDGAEVAWPFEVKIGEETVEQIDGVVYSDGLSTLIECKDWATPANVEPIAKLRNQLLRRPSGVLGMIVSRNGFTEAARSLAQFIAPQAILLWEGEEIGIVLQRQAIRGALQRKYRYAVEKAAPDYNLRNEKLL